MDKIDLKIVVDDQPALISITDDLKNHNKEGKFIIVPKGGDGLNSNVDMIEILVTLFENLSAEFIIFFAGIIYNSFKRDKIKTFKFKCGKNDFMIIKSDMNKKEIRKLVKQALKKCKKNKSKK